MSEPPLYQELLNRQPRPPLRFTSPTSKPFSREISSTIVDSLYNPILEAALHLLNDDLFTSHFLVRKMQGDLYGDWVHAVLHRIEGDYGNSKCWYREMSDQHPAWSFWAENETACRQGRTHAWQFLDSVAATMGKDVNYLLETNKRAEIEYEGSSSEALGECVANRVNKEMLAQRNLEELKFICERLIEEHGWTRNVNGIDSYVKSTPEQIEAKKGFTLGEGNRRF